MDDQGIKGESVNDVIGDITIDVDESLKELLEEKDVTI